MADNEVVIHVRAEDATGPGLAKARANAKRAGEEIEKDLKQSGRKGGAGIADGIAEGAGKARESAASVGDTIVDQLGKAGQKGGKALGDGITEGIEGAGGGGGGSLGDKLIPSLGKAGVKGGKAAGSGFIESFGNALGQVGDNPYVLAAAAGIGIALTPAIGGALAAAVIGAGGGLGIVGGFAAAAMDPRVKGASTALKDVIEDDLKLASKSFVPEAVGAINEVRDAWKDILPDVASIFDQSAGLMDPLLDGILDGVHSLVDGIEISLGGSGPVFESFGDLFREFGQIVGDVFANLSDNGPQAAAAIDFLSAALNAAVSAIGIFMEVSLFLVEAIRPIGGVVADATNAIDNWLNSLLGGGDEGDEFADTQKDIADATDDATDSTNDQISALRQLEETMRKQTDPLFAVFDLQVKVRKAQEDYNKAVEASGPESAKARKALLAMGQASFELTSALTTAASEGFNGKLTPAMRNALRNAGNTADQINALERELIQAWRAANKWSGTYTQTYVTRYKEYGLKSPGAMGGFQGLAHGGIKGAANGSMSSGMTMVGEYGPELVNLPPGTQVHSAPDTQRMMGAGGGGGLAGQGGPVSIVLKFDPSGAPEAMRGLMEGLRAEVRDGGGNVQTVLGVAGAN